MRACECNSFIVHLKIILNVFRDKFGNNVIFIVASDDIPWCKANLNDSKVEFIDHDVDSEHRNFATQFKNIRVS